jgi:iron complex transport system permease protein
LLPSAPVNASRRPRPRTPTPAAKKGRPAAKGAAGGARQRDAAAPGLVVGPVPVVARVVGGVAVAGALCRFVAVGFPLAHVRGRGVGAAANAFDWLVTLPYVAVLGGAGVLLVLGRLPRLGLAAARVVGLLSAGLVAQTIYLLDASQRSTTDLPLGIGTSLHYTAGTGLVLLAAGYALAVAALVGAQVAWPRTVMEDDGELDRLRPRLAAWGLPAGIAAAIALGLSPYSSSAAHLAPPAVPERAGWDLAGGALLALAAGACAVLPATFHPRLAAVGGYAAAAGVLATLGLSTALLVARSPVITPSGAGVATLVVAAVFAGLALVAWRLARPARPARPAEPAKPARPVKPARPAKPGRRPTPRPAARR